MNARECNHHENRKESPKIPHQIAIVGRENLRNLMSNKNRQQMGMQELCVVP
jgi:hypothetical protein